MGKGSIRGKKIVQCLLAGGLAVILGRCAGQIPPGGGPLDTTPPEIVGTSPAHNSVRVTTRKITLEFSEYVERRTVEESVFISPFVGELEFDWGGRTVDILFPEPLRENRTYVVNVGTDVVDRRARNRMSAAFTLAFSTGDSIDVGMINGKVFDPQPEGVMIFAYLLDHLNPDTLDPAVVRPDFITQTGSNGTFAFSNLPDGWFRIFAVRDEYRDLFYSRHIDAYGVFTRDLVLGPDNRILEDVQFRMTREDTTKPFITSVAAMDLTAIQIRFSEPLDRTSVSNAIVSVTDSSTGVSIETGATYQLPAAASLLNVSIPFGLVPGATYLITVWSVADTAGNRVDSVMASLLAVGERDTIPPTLAIQGLADSVMGVSPDKSILLWFSEPPNRRSFEAGVTVTDSTETGVEVAFSWSGYVECHVLFKRRLDDDAWYSLQIRLDSLVDGAGNRGKDSTITVRFRTSGLRSTGSIEGTVFDEKRDATGPIVVSVSSAGITPQVHRNVYIPGPGRFVIERLPEGSYLLAAFRDSDTSGTYGYGLPYPFQPSERFTVLDDTLRVRVRWGVEGVLLRLKP